MSMRIGGATDSLPLRLQTEAGAGEAPTVADTSAAAAPSFGGVIEETLRAANAREVDAVAKADALASGKLDDLHGTMISMKEAEISLKLVGSVRNKLLDAFRELWRTNV
jgi:flagellar hook-basal body complex protein FliE